MLLRCSKTVPLGQPSKVTGNRVQSQLTAEPGLVRPEKLCLECDYFIMLIMYMVGND